MEWRRKVLDKQLAREEAARVKEKVQSYKEDSKREQALIRKKQRELAEALERQREQQAQKQREANLLLNEREFALNKHLLRELVDREEDIELLKSAY